MTLGNAFATLSGGNLIVAQDAAQTLLREFEQNLAIGYQPNRDDRELVAALATFRDSAKALRSHLNHFGDSSPESYN